MATDRKAEVTWRGDLMSGKGRVDSVTSGAVGGLDVSWPARSEDPDGMTSPEELIAAAHATCFSMALSGGLTVVVVDRRVGHALLRLLIRAFELVEQRFEIAGHRRVRLAL